MVWASFIVERAMISGMDTSVNSPKYWFFLGGRDLEMRAIERLLKRNGQSYTWLPEVNWSNSGWALYQAGIIHAKSLDFTPVGVELNNTHDPVPKGSIDIDHHNERSQEKSSLEQVAAILGVSLSKFEMAVAANDIGHVRAMRSLGLVQSDIDRIRRLDRRTQGVTPLQDKQAEELVEQHHIHSRSELYSWEHGDIDVVFAGQVPYSAIADLMIKSNKLLLWSEGKFCYYGPGVGSLAREFNAEIEQGVFYHGGGSSGYFGLAEGKVSKDEAVLFRNKIVKLMRMPFSHHIFLLPFRWDYRPEDSKVINNWVKKTPFEKRMKLADLYTSVIKPIIGNTNEIALSKSIKWRVFEFGDRFSNQDYNELIYFHGFVRETLFDEGSLSRIKDASLLALTLDERSDPEQMSPLKYRINILKEHGVNKKLADFYDLELQEVSLNFYETGIAVMGFHLNNHHYPEPDSVLAINDFGRRLFPQFLGDGPELLAGPMGAFLPRSIELMYVDSEERDSVLMTESWQDFKHPVGAELRKFVPFLPAHVMGLLGDKFHLRESEVKKGEVLVSSLVDDRMFVLSWFGHQATTNKLSTNPDAKLKEDIYGKRDHVAYGYESDDWWNKYVFIDGKGPSVANRNLLREQNRKHTYARFVEWGTLYGLSRYSLVCVTDRGAFSANTLKHIQTVYFQLVMLCLVQRASVLAFSNEVTGLASQIPDNRKGREEKDGLVNRFTELHRAYIRFVNKVYFREAATQEQGIELYQMLQRFMEIERDVKDLNREVDEMHQFVQMQEAEDREASLSTITLLGFLFVIPSLITGYYGMNVFGLSEHGWFVSDMAMFKKVGGLLFILVLLLLFGVLAKMSNRRLFCSNRLPINKSIFLVALFVLVLLLFIPFC